MNEGINIPELELDRATNIIESHDLAEIGNEFQSPVYLSPMIIRHFQNKQIFKDISLHGHLSPFHVNSKCVKLSY
jgi:hypothetical protein